MAAVRELNIEIADQPGTLGIASEVLGKAGINIDGFGVWEGCARLLVDDVETGLAILREAGFVCRTQKVLRLDLPDEPGNLSEVAQALGQAGINIDHAYTVTPSAEGAATFVLAVVDPHTAKDVLAESPAR